MLPLARIAALVVGLSACTGGGETAIPPASAGSSQPGDPPGSGNGSTTGAGPAAPRTTRYCEPDVATSDSADWDGNPIRIQVAGVSVAINGGVKVTASASTTRVNAKARLVADALDKAAADDALQAVRASFEIRREAGAIVVACARAKVHGTTWPDNAGCELVEVEIPAGAPGRALDLDIMSGNGGDVLELATATVAKVRLRASGASIVARLPASVGGRIELVGERAADIEARLPSGWTADEILLEADADRVDNRAPGAKPGASAGGRGTSGTGLALLQLTSRPFAGTTGRLMLE